MRRVKIEFTFDDVKLDALRLFMKEKGVSLEEELDRAMDTLYKKYVPQTIRDYFDKQEWEARQAAEAKKSKAKKPVTPVGIVSDPPKEG